MTTIMGMPISQDEVELAYNLGLEDYVEEEEEEDKK